MFVWRSSPSPIKKSSSLQLPKWLLHCSGLSTTFRSCLCSGLFAKLAVMASLLLLQDYNFIIFFHLPLGFTSSFFPFDEHMPWTFDFLLFSRYFYVLWEPVLWSGQGTINLRSLAQMNGDKLWTLNGMFPEQEEYDLRPVSKLLTSAV
jgi:hypothetical protein